MAKTISFNLSPSSIEKAVKDLRKYQKSLQYKCELFCETLVELGNIVASAKINESPLGKYIVVTTNISPQTMGCKAMLTAVGQTTTNSYGSINYLMLVEFGAGIYFNPVENPFASKYQMGVGTFPNQTHAFENGWYYPDDKGEWHYTHGTQATMPMYNADTQMVLSRIKLAKEIFNRD